MTKAPRSIPGKAVVKALGRLGFLAERQTGSHLTLRRQADGARVTIPMHGTIRVGTLLAALKGAGVALQDLLDAL